MKCKMYTYENVVLCRLKAQYIEAKYFFCYIYLLNTKVLLYLL